MNTPANPANQSLLSGSSASVVVSLPSQRMGEAVPTRKWKGDFVGERTPPIHFHGSEPTSSVGQSPMGRSWIHGERIPAWLVSTIVHTLVILALVLIQVQAGSRGLQSILVRLDKSDSEQALLEQITVAQDPLEVDADASNDTPSHVTSQEILAASSVFRMEPSLSAVSASKVESPALTSAFSDAESTASRSVQLPVGGLYRRDSKSRGELGEMYGATPESEEAVEAALRWLAAHQQRDGSWSFDLSQEPCNGRCGNSHDSSANVKPPTAATGLAILAFLGAGYSQHEGIYADNVRRGLYFLREEAKQTAAGLDLQSGSMYGHGIAMMAIAEAMAMTRYQGKTDSDLFSLVNGGSSFTMAAQHDKGGWRYVPGSPGDMTVTCWQVLSLISAQHGGVVLRTDTLSKAERYVRGLSKPDMFAFGYQSTEPKRTTTAVGLCMLLYLGQSPKQTNFGLALNRLAESGPKLTDVYHDYYATLALHHARHRQWDAWHVPVRDHLIKTQATQGHEAGSWHFEDTHGDVGGRLYTTAMSAMILEVYYRYLPLYQTRDEFKLD